MGCGDRDGCTCYSGARGLTPCASLSRRVTRNKSIFSGLVLFLRMQNWRWCAEQCLVFSSHFSSSFPLSLLPSSSCPLVPSCSLPPLCSSFSIPLPLIHIVHLLPFTSSCSLSCFSSFSFSSFSISSSFFFHLSFPSLLYSFPCSFACQKM